MSDAVQTALREAAVTNSRLHTLLALLRVATFAVIIAAAARGAILRIDNVAEGNITWEDSEGAMPVSLGHVREPLRELNPFQFQAAKWGRDSAVCATAVNGIHVKLYTLRNSADGHPVGSVGFSILPRPFSSASGIQTNLDPGTVLFGPSGPCVGAEVHILDSRGQTKTEGGIALGDRVCISWEPRVEYLLGFVNIQGGGIYYQDSFTTSPRKLGVVLQELHGTGRFDGGQYASAWTVRANHPGVICVSTSPREILGGFQIIPSEHARETELTYTRGNAAYMIVELTGAEKSAGESPLFRDVIKPGDGVHIIANGKLVTDLSPIEGKTKDSLSASSFMKLGTSDASNSSFLILITNIAEPRRLTQMAQHFFHHSLFP